MDGSMGQYEQPEVPPFNAPEDEIFMQQPRILAPPEIPGASLPAYSDES